MQSGQFTPARLPVRANYVNPGKRLMNSPQIDAGHEAAQMRAGGLSAYHQSVNVGVIAGMHARVPARPAEAGG
jgi:hypothetical protein